MLAVGMLWVSGAAPVSAEPVEITIPEDAIASGVVDEEQIRNTFMLDRYKTIVNNNAYGMAVTENGELYIFGLSTVKMNNVDVGDYISPMEPLKIMDNVKAVDMDISGMTCAALTQDDELYLWGYNGTGNVGNGMTNYQYEPLKVLTDINDFEMNDSITIAVTNDGKLYLWGTPYFLEGSDVLEEGSCIYTDFLSPTRIVEEIENIEEVELHDKFCLVIDSWGDLYVFGHGYGDLCGDEKGKYHAPQKLLSEIWSVKVSDGASSIAHIMALAHDGSLFSWGNNYLGSVGNGSYEDQLTPKLILSDVIYMDSAYDVSAAITKDGSLFVWGAYNKNGNGARENQTIPKKILSNVAYVDVDNQSIAITRDGKMYIWGNGIDNPKQLLANVTYAITDGQIGMAVKDDKTLYAWGKGLLFDNQGDVEYKPQKFEINDVLVPDMGTVIMTEHADSDNDGLPNKWEINGADVDNDGIVDVPIHEMGANPSVQDIFVEVDWMYEQSKYFNIGHKEINYQPNEEQLKYLLYVCEQFKNHGYNLHIDAGKDSIDYVTGEKWGDLSQANAVPYKKSLSYNDNGNEYLKILWPDDDKEVNFKSGREKVFRHCMIVNQFRVINTEVAGYTFGLAGTDRYDPSNFFLVAAGAIKENKDFALACTFMHELGHSLGLSHGGVLENGDKDNINLKPNYLSVMNYLFSPRGLIGAENVAALNYSEYSLPEINETDIDESKGVDPEGVTSGSNLGTAWIKNWLYAENPPIEYNIAGKAIDFNRNGEIETSISMNLNYNEDTEEKKTILKSSQKDWDFIEVKTALMEETAAPNSNYALASFKYKQFNQPVYDDISIDELYENGLMGYPGDCSIAEITSLDFYKDIENQKIKVKISNMHNTPTSPTIKITSDFNNLDYEEKIDLAADQNRENAYVVTIPVDKADKTGNYDITFELFCENGEVITETEKLVVKEPDIVNLLVGTTEDIFNLPELMEKDVEWNIADNTIVTIENNRITAKEIGETQVSGYIGDELFIVNIRVLSAEDFEKEENKKSVTEIFTDVYDDWYTPYVQYVYDNNLMTGIKGTTLFQPNHNITKAQVAQVLYNMEEQPAVTEKKVFSELNDVYEVEWYANAVAWAYNTGVVTGDLNTKKFNPNADVTREQLALMMFRYAKFKEYDTTATSEFAGLVNADKVNNWAAEGMSWAVGSGLISGIEKNGVKDLAPQGNASRAQMAAILQRFCENVAK